MKRIWLAAIVLLFTIPAMAQSESESLTGRPDYLPHSRWSVGLNGGLDFTSDMYWKYQNGPVVDADKNDFNVGVDAIFRASKIFRMRLELKYDEYSFGQELNTNLYKTCELTLQTMDINPRLDFRFWHKKSWEAFVTVGLRLEYSLDSNQKIIKLDGTESDQSPMSSAYSTSMSGGIGGAILKYNLNDRWGIIFNPEYTLFFDKLYSSNDNSMKRLSFNVGVEYNL